MLFGILLLVALQPYKKRVSRHFQSNTILYVMFYDVIMLMEQISTQGYLVVVFLLGFVIAAVPPLGTVGLLLYWLLLKLRSVSFHFQWWQRQGYATIEDSGAGYSDRAVNPHGYSIASSQLVNCDSLGIKGDTESND
jgi:hypothetical protein